MREIYCFVEACADRKLCKLELSTRVRPVSTVAGNGENGSCDQFLLSVGGGLWWMLSSISRPTYAIV